MSCRLHVTVMGAQPGLTQQIIDRLQEVPDAVVKARAAARTDVLVYVADRSSPGLTEAEHVFQSCVQSGAVALVLVSSARCYGARPQNPGLILEQRFPLASGAGNPWVELEALASRCFAPAEGRRLVILRPSTVALRGGTDSVNRLIQSRLAPALPGHDPGIQLLSAQDLAEAVAVVLQRGTGVYNIAPDAPIPLRQAIRLAGGLRVPVPRTLQRLFHRGGQLDYVRYSWTVSNRRMRDELGFTPRRSSRDALLEALGNAPTSAPAGEFDAFGMDKGYIAAYGRTVFDFLYRMYWRIEESGIEHVPGAGPAVLVGVHRGFMPFDGVMALHSIVRKLGRYPRFLVHPGLIKFPFLFNFMRKLGGIMACQENAEFVLDRGEMVGIFPEGIRGAFTAYRDAHRIAKFASDDFVKLALRKGAPIVPFVTVGSAEIFPILAKWNWNWWKRYTGWPAFPITPTFPFLPPVPLPAKWHTQWLPAVPAGTEYPPEAANDPLTVRSISRQVRSAMERSMRDMLDRRKSVFFGSVFGPDASQPQLPVAEQSFQERIR
jgi:1-acyl-sn-glycerol-3-phosphate acyltransferase/nucleoside-diphosphate-sugar epimerase